jgi:hypothetical protein
MAKAPQRTEEVAPRRILPSQPPPDGTYGVLDDPRCIVRTLSPNVQLFVERGLTILPKDRDDYPDQVLFLDGVYSGAPFMDNERRHYALDHHAGCVRSFTLATCEQAAVVVLMGLPLREGTWRIYVNEPDLDAVLASWILLNHKRLTANNKRLLREIMPLVRVEGNIDTHGHDMTELAAIPAHVYKLHKSRLDALRTTEVELKAARLWEREDPIDYTTSQLHRLDRQLMGAQREQAPPSSAGGMGEIAWPQKRVAVLCRSSQGIYEVEEELKESHGRALGIIVLDRGDGHMTVLQVDPFMHRSLNDLYPRLNDRDPNADPDSGDVWGGSAEIGGSPRRAGTVLSGHEVLKAIAEMFGVDKGDV